MRAIVLILLAAIVVSLASGLFYLSGKSADPEKLQKAFRVRLILSGALIGFLVLGYALGWFEA